MYRIQWPGEPAPEFAPSLEEAMRAVLHRQRLIEFVGAAVLRGGAGEGLTPGTPPRPGVGVVTRELRNARHIVAFGRRPEQPSTYWVVADIYPCDPPTPSG